MPFDTYKPIKSKPWCDASTLDKLGRLSAFIRTLPHDHWIYRFVRLDTSGSDLLARREWGLAECGTVGCAIGHGSAAGICDRFGDDLKDAMGSEAYSAIFRKPYPGMVWDVPSSAVADRIDAYIATGAY